MESPESLLESLRGTRFGPVQFHDSETSARCSGFDVELAADGPTVLATWSVPLTAIDATGRAAVAQHAAASAALLEVDDDGDSGALFVRCWASSCTAGEVAAAVRAVALAAQARAKAAPPGTPGESQADAASPMTEEDLAAQPLPEDVERALGMLALACSTSLADVMRQLLRGEREQVTLARHQLDELTGAVFGDVTVFNVGAGSRGGASVHALLPSGRVVDVQVHVDANGFRIEPASEGEELRVGLGIVERALAARGRTLARVATADDALVVVTERR